MAIKPSIGATIDGNAAPRNVPSRLTAVPKRNSGRRGRSRKRRSSPQAVSQGPVETATAAAAAAAAAAGERASRGTPSTKREHTRHRDANRRGAGSFTEQIAALGERPRAPWHPLPLSELLILVGLIGAVIGFSRRESGLTLLFTSIGAIALGTIEFTLREHLAGYRSHTILLASVPTAVFHSLAAVALAAIGAPTTASVLVPLLLHVPVFYFFFRLLRGRFLDARRERMRAAGR